MTQQENTKIYAYLKNSDYMDDFEKESALNNGCYDLFIDDDLLFLKRVAETASFFEVYKRI